MAVERSSLDLDDLIGDDDEPAIVAITLAELGVGVEITSGKRQRGAHDLIIAATALATGRMVVSSDRMAFADIPGLSVRPADRD